MIFNIAQAQVEYIYLQNRCVNIIMVIAKFRICYWESLKSPNYKETHDQPSVNHKYIQLVVWL